MSGLLLETDVAVAEHLRGIVQQVAEVIDGRILSHEVGYGQGVRVRFLASVPGFPEVSAWVFHSDRARDAQQSRICPDCFQMPDGVDDCDCDGDGRHP